MDQRVPGGFVMLQGFTNAPFQCEDEQDEECVNLSLQGDLPPHLIVFSKNNITFYLYQYLYFKT